MPPFASEYVGVTSRMTPTSRIVKFCGSTTARIAEEPPPDDEDEELPPEDCSCTS